MLHENLNVLLVGRDVNKRSQLRELLNSYLHKSTVRFEKDLNGLVRRLIDPKAEAQDFILLLSDITIPEISTFLKEHREGWSKKRPAIIVCLNSSAAQKSAQVAGLYLEGVDGFVSEPYSSAELQALFTTIREAQAKKAPEIGHKVKKAAEFLMIDAVGLIDDLANRKIEGHSGGGTSIKNLRSVSESLKTLLEQSPQEYEKLLIEAFEKAKPSEVVRPGRKKAAPRKRVVHPGTILWELMSERKLKVEDLMRLCKLSAEDLEGLIHGKVDLTAEMAFEISRVVGLSPRAWMRYQTSYDEYKKSQEQK